MFRLTRLNIERVVANEHDKDKLIKQGYKLVIEEPIKENTDDLNKLTVDQLKELAEEKGIEIPSKAKKDEIIEMLKEVE